MSYILACLKTYFSYALSLGTGTVDYFELTGMAPPEPLPNFDIKKAKARPYRPFRWEYHQTMGK